MDLRVGIDLVSVESIRESIAAHGDRYLARVYTPQELEDCRGRAGGAGPDPERLAARFAAKEAAFKALHVGDQAVAWLDVQTRRGPTGWDNLILRGRAADIAARAGITDLSVSITHARGHAAAVVIAEISKTADSESMTQTIRTT
jgi:holo-[acyl-carrier protein] synthase